MIWMICETTVVLRAYCLTKKRCETNVTTLCNVWHVTQRGVMQPAQHSFSFVFQAMRSNGNACYAGKVQWPRPFYKNNCFACPCDMFNALRKYYFNKLRELDRERQKLSILLPPRIVIVQRAGWRCFTRKVKQVIQVISGIVSSYWFVYVIGVHAVQFGNNWIKNS